MSNRHNRLNKVVAPALPLLQAGTAYRVCGYHTGDFVGTCKVMGRKTATFTVNAPLQSTLAPGAEIEIPLGLAQFAAVAQANTKPTPLQADLGRRSR